MIVRELEPPAMKMDHGEHEAEAEARSRHVVLAAAIELPRHQLALALGDAGTVVADLQAQQALGRAYQADRDLASRGRVFDRVVEEIADRLGQKVRIALDDDRRSTCGRREVEG